MRAVTISLMILAFVLVFSTLTNSSATEVVSIGKGPRTEDVIFRFYSDRNQAYDALKRGEVDIVGSLYYQMLPDAIADSNIVLAPFQGTIYYYRFDLNNNWTIATYPGVRSPLNYQSFRQAIAFLTDKEYIVNTICGGLAERVDQPVCAHMKGWGDPSVLYPNYPYEYNPQAAANLLDAAGFAEGSTPNAYYDPEFPGSARYIRQYPLDHNTKPGQDLDPLEVIVRSEVYRRLGAGRFLYGNMRKCGIPCNVLEGPSSIVWEKFDEMNYHIYTGGGYGGRGFAPVYYYYHSDYWGVSGYNHFTGMNASNLPNYPELDELLFNVTHADTYVEALSISQKALRLFTELCISIPLWADLDFFAYSTDVLGVCSMRSYGLSNDITFMNAYKADGSPIRYGTINPPEHLNILIDPVSYYEILCLERVYEYSSLDAAPLNLALIQPGFVLDWNSQLWDDNGTLKHKFTKRFRNDSFFVEAGTGFQLENVDADAYLFSSFLIYAVGRPNGWHWDEVAWLHHIDKVDDHTVDIYYDERGYLLTLSGSPPLIPKSVWLNETTGLLTREQNVFVVGANLTTPGPANLTNPVWFESVKADGSPLSMFTDYNWIKGDLHILTALTPSTIVELDYWALGNITGYTPGNLPWRQILSGSGTHYVTDHVPGVGGYMALKRNPYYWMETPVLGEIDFVWEAGGYYEITIFDVVRAATAYDTQGTAMPDKKWFPAADLAPIGGYIDIFDIVTLASRYGETFGAPP